MFFMILSVQQGQSNSIYTNMNEVIFKKIVEYLCYHLVKVIEISKSYKLFIQNCKVYYLSFLVFFLFFW